MPSCSPPAFAPPAIPPPTRTQCSPPCTQIRYAPRAILPADSSRIPTLPPMPVANISSPSALPSATDAEIPIQKSVPAPAPPPETPIRSRTTQILVKIKSSRPQRSPSLLPPCQKIPPAVQLYNISTTGLLVSQRRPPRSLGLSPAR